jgi:predicted small secreted protein
MKRMVLGSICLVLAVVCIGCSTIKGMGEDVSTVGGWMVKGSDNVQQNEGTTDK